MKLNQSLEQAIAVLLMLAVQTEHRPVKSHVLSSVLGVSDSYLKKILRRLVVAGLISSNASKDGGFQLAQDIMQMSLRDVFVALENNEPQTALSELGQRLFDDVEHVAQGQAKIIQTWQNANVAFEQALQNLRLGDLLERERREVDWEQHHAARPN